MRDANKINHGDEKLIVRILYGGFDAYEKSKNGKLKNKIRYKLYKALNHFFVKWLCGADIPLSVKMGGYKNTAFQWNHNSWGCYSGREHYDFSAGCHWGD